MNNYTAWLKANNIPALSDNNVYLDTTNNNKTTMDYSDAGETAGGVFGSIFGGPLGGAIGSMAGNLIGQGVNYAANKSLQENQLSNQMELQSRAYNLNQQAVQNQAQNEVIGMRNAGLNPASVNGQGAPSLQAGAAAGANSTMGNIFGGLAEMIAAIKAPTEIEKMQAEKALTEGQTEKTAAETDLTHEQKYNLMLDSDLVKPEQAREIFERANLHVQEAQKALAQADNTNALTDIINAQNDFIKQYSSSIYSGYMDNLKSTKQWDKLPPRTRETIEKLASGDITMGTGELQGLKEIVNSQTGLLERDRDALNALLNIIVTRGQIDTKNIIDALKNLPENERKKLFSEISRNYADALESTENAKGHKVDRRIKTINEPAYKDLYGDNDPITGEPDSSIPAEEQNNIKRYNKVIDNIISLTDPKTYLMPLATIFGARTIAKGQKVNNKNLDKPDHGKGSIFKGGLGDWDQGNWSKGGKKTTPWIQSNTPNPNDYRGSYYNGNYKKK